MCLPALPLAIIGSAVLGAGASIYSANKAGKAQSAALKQQEEQAARAEQSAAKAAQADEEQFNKLNQKTAAIPALADANRRAASSGLGSTFLTGASGVRDLSSYLGGASLLGA